MGRLESNQTKQNKTIRLKLVNFLSFVVKEYQETTQKEVNQ